MDKNQVTGIVLITLLMLGYFLYVGKKDESKNFPAADTLVIKEAASPVLSNADLPGKDSVSSAANIEKLGDFASAANGEEKTIVLENNEVKIFFSSKGGRVKKVLLKKYLTDTKKPLFIMDESNTKMSLLAISGNREVDLNKLYFVPAQQKAGNTQVLTFRLSLSGDKYIEQSYFLPPSGYVLDYKLKFVGMDNIISNKPLQFSWKENIPKIENDVPQARERSTVNYFTKAEDFDNLNESSKSEEFAKIDEPLKWVSLKQKFFNTGIIAKNSFEGGSVKSFINTTDTSGIKQLEMTLNIPVGDVKTDKGVYQFYFGPNHFQTLKKVTEGYHKNVYLGWPVINWVNRFVAIPTFNFLKGFISSYGIIIIILAILVKLILLPLSFKSQVSMAKMKVMKPELDEIKARFPDDMQKQQTEQMALYSKVGINPLSGCIPVLLSMPVLLAMFSFFPNSIELRQESFLWAPDLSTYDAPIHLPFTIPFYGSHVSIFTLLMTLSTIALTFFNNQVSTVTGPMKSVSYMMPVVFMFMLNSFPAGLSFYYLVSNILSIGQQYLIRHFVDEDKIRLKLEENKKKNAAAGTGGGKKSKFMQRMEEAMKAKEIAAKKK
jgi:YidC/Oxa1 family membrane protein insertase